MRFGNVFSKHLLHVLAHLDRDYTYTTTEGIEGAAHHPSSGCPRGDYRLGINTSAQVAACPPSSIGKKALIRETGHPTGPARVQ